MTREEIVIALRCCAFNGEDSCKHCTECPATGDDCESELQFAAADLIENQQNHIRALLQANDALRQRWIPVTERLPEDGQDVLCWYEYFRYGDYNAMFETYGIGYQYFGHWGGEVSHGTNARVLAWMPLPPALEED